MAIISTVTKLVKLDASKSGDFFKSLIFSQVEFETLNPSELGSQWSDVNYYTSPRDGQSLVDSLQEVNQILEKNVAKKGKFAAFADNRIVSTLQKIEQVGQKEDSISKVVKLISKYNELILTQEKTDVFLEKNSKFGILVGTNINFIEADFNQYLSSILAQSQKNKLDYTKKLETPKVTVNNIEGITFLTFEKRELNLIKNYLNTKNQELISHTGEEFALLTAKQIQQIRQEISHYLDSQDKLTTEAKELLICFSAFIEMEIKILKAGQNIFAIDKNSNTHFVFINLPQTSLNTFEKVLTEMSLTSQEVDWTSQIVDWTNPGALKSFQGVAQSIGTITPKEADPTSSVAIFFMIFFGFCLGDAIYGLIISAFTGYFLFFRGAKPGFKNIFNIFFYSGLVSILIGVLTNSWAGDFFNSDFTKILLGLDKNVDSTPINDVLKNFQLIDVINVKADAPVNQAITAVSPIIIMMLIALFIGFLNQFIGYYYRIRTNVGSGKWNIVLGQLAWIFFLVVGITWISVNALEPSLIQPITWLLFASFATLFVFNQAASFGGKILGFLLGPRGLYGVLQLGANLISYVRIFAIGLTGSIIANIVNLLAGLLYEAGGPIFGLIIGILVLIIGHVFNFVLSAFGAYINPLRLTYVEFMPGFYEGEGRQINKVDTEFTHLKIIPKNDQEVVLSFDLAIKE
jgi:vacuolar-type H+-ATPase subunit I/STV1